MIGAMPMSREDLHQLFDLTGRVAIVTGGSRGLGRAVAEGLAAVGASVVIASRKAEACQAVADELVAAGHEALAVPTHVGHPDELGPLVERTVERFGRLDVLVNNAANALAQPFGSITEAALDASLAVNVKGPLLLAQEALPHLVAGGHGAIVNVISVGAFRGSPLLGLYGAGKAALWHLTRTLAAEVVGQGVRVNALAPGPVDTDMIPEDPAFRQAIIDSTKVGRLASPRELVPAAVFLASDASSYMTGAVLTVDGGSMA